MWLNNLVIVEKSTSSWERGAFLEISKFASTRRGHSPKLNLFWFEFLL